MIYNNKWTTSLDGELYRGGYFDTKEEAIADMNNDLPEGTTFWVGQVKEVVLGHLISADTLIEDMQCQADDAAGEAAEDFLRFMKKGDIDELNDLLIKWFTDKGYTPDFYGIDNSEKLSSNK